MTDKLVAEIPQGELAALQIRLEVWRGRPRVDARIFSGPERARRATLRGFCIPPGQLDRVIEALVAAKREAVVLGWLPDEGQAK